MEIMRFDLTLKHDLISEKNYYPVSMNNPTSSVPNQLHLIRLSNVLSIHVANYRHLFKNKIIFTFLVVHIF